MHPQLNQHTADSLTSRPVAFEDKLERAVRSCPGLVVIATQEEERALRAVKAVGETLGRPAISFDIAEGFRPLSDGNRLLPSAKDPLGALDQIDQADGEALYVLKDAHDWWANPQMKRKLRNVAQRLKSTRRRLIVTCPDSDKLPSELMDAAIVMEPALPTASELSAVLDHLALSPGVTIDLDERAREQLLQAAGGLTESQAQRVFAGALVEGGRLDVRAIDGVAREKARIIAESKALEVITEVVMPEHVGGLGAPKQWLRLRHAAFTPEGKRYGLPSPRGLLLIGIPGTGKSLTAKMTAGLWHLPLLRLEAGALFGSLVGESEAMVRRTLRQAEAIAPCVLWIDELEKAFAGTRSSGATDGGTTSRVFGTFLSWLQDKQTPVFVVATANDVSALPPELVRRGRFDETFFLDLPDFAEREEIFTVHLGRRGRPPQIYDLESLARASAGYVGSEIEQAIIEAMYLAFSEGAREFTTKDILAALQNLIPLSRSQAEVIQTLRRWLHEGRARPASFPEARIDPHPSAVLPLEPT